MKKMIFPTIGIVSFALSVLIGVYALGRVEGDVFLGILSVLLLLAAIGSLITELILREKHEKMALLDLDTVDKEYFENSEVIPVFSTRRMFGANMRKQLVTEATDRVANAEITLGEDIELAKTATGLVAFAKERGCELDASTAAQLLAGFASSRILIFKQLPTEDYELLIQIICEFFGTDVYMDRASNNDSEHRDVLFDGSGEKKAAMRAIEAAQAAGEKQHFVAFDNVATTNILDWCAPFVNYAKVPQAAHYISASLGDATSKYYLPENLWIILNLAQGEEVAALPTTLLEVSSVIGVSVNTCEIAEICTLPHPIAYSQMVIATEKANCEVDESEWKKFDLFTALLNEHVPLEISNKQWVGIEKYVAVLCACGENIATAFDLAISARVAPSVMSCVIAADKNVDVTACLSAAFQDSELLITRKALRTLGKAAPRK